MQKSPDRQAFRRSGLFSLCAGALISLVLLRFLGQLEQPGLTAAELRRSGAALAAGAMVFCRKAPGRELISPQSREEIAASDSPALPRDFLRWLEETPCEAGEITSELFKPRRRPRPGGDRPRPGGGPGGAHRLCDGSARPHQPRNKGMTHQCKKTAGIFRRSFLGSIWNQRHQP